MESPSSALVENLALIILKFYLHFNTAEEEFLNRGEATRMLALMKDRVGALDKELLRPLVDQIRIIAEESEGEAQRLTLGLPDAFGLPQRLASDEPAA